MVARIANSSRKTRVHIFTDQAVYDELMHVDLGAGVILYPPGEAARYAIPAASAVMTEEHRTQPERLESPWLLWMRDALMGTSIDIAHFLCHGYMSVDRGALAMAESPTENSDETTARFVGTAELTAFLTQVGAWAVAFSSPPRNFSEMGLRVFADTLAQLRPLFVLYHDLDEGGDPHCEAMERAYRLFASPEPGRPPVSASVFMYCQPYRVKGGTLPEKPRKSPAIAVAEASPDLVNLVRSSENVPNWIAASQRYIDQCQWQLRKTGPQGGQDASSTARGQKEAVEKALHDIQQAVTRLASMRSSQP